LPLNLNNGKKLVMTKQLQLRSRVKGQLSRTVLKTNGGGNKSVEFNPIRHRERKQVHFGFRTGDIVKAIVTTGKKIGEYIGRVLCRRSGSFDIVTKTGRIAGISQKFCISIHKKDGYSYGF
ncbi:MAG: HNH endonuclease, partial [Calothrix sp. MO_192.B10]|nr:HNH endonuclease [Calothrix sp. MO_192.B10]